jgi:hypothetical protein
MREKPQPADDNLFNRASPFLTTSSTGNWPERLRLRYRAIIRDNIDRIKNARILDIGSHDGRWSFAALQAGALHVTGIELRRSHVDSAYATLSNLGISKDRYQFHCGDIFDHQNVFDAPYDVVFCLGFLYHTARHAELLALIHKTGAGLLILDTAISRRSGPVLELLTESAHVPGNGSFKTDYFSRRVLVAHPSLEAIDLLLEHYSYEVTRFDWAQLLNCQNMETEVSRRATKGSPVADYASGSRVTIRAIRPNS